MIDNEIQDMQKALVQAGCVDPAIFEDARDSAVDRGTSVSRIESALKSAREAQQDLREISDNMRRLLVNKVLELGQRIEEPQGFEKLRQLLEKVLCAVDEFKREQGFVEAYADVLSIYLYVLYRCGSPGNESPIVKLILNNRARRKAVELNTAERSDRLRDLETAVTIAIIAKRYAVYLMATKGFRILFRNEIDFRTFGTSPESLALQITNILLKHGIGLADVTDIVCAGGDLGTLPDGIYVLNETVRQESLKRLKNSSLNRGALVACELRDLLSHQGGREPIHLSLVSPLSFSTLGSYENNLFLKPDSMELSRSLKGYVKVTPLKSIAALISEIQRISPEELNLVVMCLDELFASVVRKIGPRVIREMGQQDANQTLNRFDFDRIVDALEKERFKIPSRFRLASREIGTGVKEICELLMIIESGRLSPQLSRNLKRVVDAYAGRVASVLEMASAGHPHERPHFVAITSMMALDHHFQQLFLKIRNRIENPFTPIMCLDSLEHEYLIANHLFEMYINPAKGDARLQFTVEARSMRHALQVLGAAGVDQEVFSFTSLLDRVTAAISEGLITPGKLVLVGADNEDALVAVANARDCGLIKKLVLVGDPKDIAEAIDHTKIPLSPNLDEDITVLPIDRLAVDFESKKSSMAEVFRDFLLEHPDFIIMKGSLSTAPLLKEALSIYKSEAEKPASPNHKRMASHTALFVLPDRRFFALSDAAVNPGFRSAEDLLVVIENQIEILRRVVSPSLTLKVAIITAVETQTSAIPATHLAAQVVEQAEQLQEKYGPLIVEGPLSFDLATVPDTAGEKHYEGRIVGDANCLIATDINTANVLYKMLSKTMGSLGIMVDAGSIITAGPGTAPIVLTSRGDTAQTKFNSILLALAYCSQAECGGIDLRSAKV